MIVHVKNYFEEYGYNESSFIPCEVCKAKAVDIHHIEPRSKFGTKTKHLQDHPENLVALCRSCHDKAHSKQISKYELKDIVVLRIIRANLIHPIKIADDSSNKSHTVSH